jgi:hypothetical protein
MAGPIRGIQKLTEDDVARATGLMRTGLTPDAVRARLIEAGMDQGIADHAVQVAGERQLLAESFEMLANGQSPDAVTQFLTGKGVPLFTAQEVVQGHIFKLQSMRPARTSARKVIGGCVVALGFALWIGNLTGAFPTFPFAGIIFILIGFAIMGS